MTPLDEPTRLHCPACRHRMDIPPKTSYAVCKHCGSEYMVQWRGGAYTLQPLTPEEFEVNREVATAEREQEMGCANTALSLIAVIVVLFCVIGGVGRLAFDNIWVCLVAWAVAFALLVPGAIIMLRNLQAAQRRKERLMQKLQPEESAED
jgi:DNA-directed RNA polymerase subunit RPC12/RpoP